MKILFLTDSLKKAGKEKQIFLLTQSLDKESIDYLIILRSNEIQFPIDRKKILVISSRRKLCIIRQLRKIIIKYRPSVIHGWEGNLSLLGLIASADLDIPFINGSIRYAKKYSKLSKTYFIQYILSYFSTLTVSNSIAGLSALGFSVDKKHLVVYNGINIESNTSILTKIKTIKDVFTIGMVANFSDAKDYTTLIKSGIILLEAGYNIRITLVGSGKNLYKFEQSIPAIHKAAFYFTNYCPSAPTRASASSSVRGTTSAGGCSCSPSTGRHRAPRRPSRRWPTPRCVDACSRPPERLQAADRAFRGGLAGEPARARASAEARASAAATVPSRAHGSRASRSRAARETEVPRSRKRA
jgi:glycosyltransferase involved in cell wall biosynthesis